MANTPALPPKVIQGAISANGGNVANGSARATTVGVQIANQIVAAPAAPTLSSTTTGGTLAAGTYQVEVSLVNQYGEVIGSSASITTTGSTSTITVTLPTFPEGINAKSWNVYCTQVNGATYTLQNPNPLPFGPGGATTFTLTAPPTSTGANPPSAPAFSGTLTFQYSIDGANWNNLTMTPFPSGTGVTTATAPGVWTAAVSGLCFFQVIATAWTSGVAVVTLNVTEG